MVAELYILAFMIGSGIVTAGIIGSFYEFVTGRRLSFFEERKYPFAIVVTVLLWFLAGPFIFFRNAMDGYFWQQFRPGMLAFAGGLSVIWSIYSGMVVMSFALAL